MSETFNPSMECLVVDWDTNKEEIRLIEPVTFSDNIGAYFRWGAFPEIVDGEYTGHGFSVEIEDKKHVTDALIRSAEINLPAGTKYEIRRNMPVHYGRGHCMFWLTNPDMQDDKPWDDFGRPIFVSDGGYVLCHRKVSTGRIFHA